jgi:ABC-type polysaccharide/polyol phosphate export permease
MPPAPIATFGERVVHVYDLMPTAHAVEALRRVLIYGDGPAEIAYELIALTTLSLLYLAFGVLLFQILRLRKI